MTRAKIKNHNSTELKIAVSLLIKPVRKKAASRLGVDQFRLKILDFTRKYFRCFDSEINRVRSKPGGMLFPVFAGALFSQSDLVRIWVVSVDRKIAIIDFLGLKQLQARE
jgi:hypothetical protein